MTGTLCTVGAGTRSSHRRRRLGVGLPGCLLGAVLGLFPGAGHEASAQERIGTAVVDAVAWPYVGGDAGNTRFSAADTLTPDNVDRLEVAWTWRPADRPRQEFGTIPGSFTSTPIMVDGTVYVSSNYNRVAALDAESGAVRWVFDPRAYADGMPALGGGFRHRGVTMWRDGEDLRIFLASRHRLFCLDAETGEVVPSFGDDGVVDLSRDLIWPIDRSHFEFNAAPVIYKDLVIVGSAVGDRVIYRRAPPGDVRAYHARTGALVWSFHTIPQEGEFGSRTWEKRGVAPCRRHQRLGRGDGRRGARTGVPAGRQSHERLLRRPEAG